MKTHLAICASFRSVLAVLSLVIVISSLSPRPARAESTSGMLWGMMDWKNDSSFPDTDTSSTRPIYQDSGSRIIAHQYQSANWLASKTSSTNKNEISRIYANGDCINLMLYFVSCTHNTQDNTFSYPLNDQFLSDYAQLLDAYKVGGGPLYIQVFPEFEEWYGGKTSTEQDQYRQKIREQFAAMVEITRTNYNKAYIGLCFESRDFIGDTSQFFSRWDPVLSISDVVFVNTMSNYRQWNTHAHEIIKSTQYLSTRWGLPIMFPYVELWADSNTPIFTDGDGNTYADDAAFFSSCITNWIGRVFTAPTETTSGATTNWATNLRTLKSRNLFAFSLYSAHYCNKPVTPPDPLGNTHALPSYTVLTNVMKPNSRSFIYPITEMEFSPTTNTPVASTTYTIEEDSNCSSGELVVLNSTSASGQHFTCKVPVTHNGTYKVLVGIRKQTDGGWFYLYVDGSSTQLGSERNCSLASGVGNYQEYDQGLITFSGITTTKWTDFKFGVSRAGNGGGYKLAIDYIKLIPQSPATIPQAPTGLIASGAGNGQISLAWNAAAGAASYNVKRSTTSGGPYSLITNVTATFYADSGLNNSTTYYYVVSALNPEGEGSNSEQASGNPGTVIVDNADATGVTITGTWTASASTAGYYGNNYLHDGNTGATGGKSVRFSPTLPVTGNYEVFLRWTADFNRASNVPVDVNHAGGTSTFSINQQGNNGVWVSLSVFSFNAGSSGNVLVRNNGANGYVIADAVKFVQATGSAPATPTGLVANPGNAQVALTWNSSSGATSYNVARALSSSGPFSNIANVGSTSHTDTGLNNGTTYYYAVSALNSFGESAYSAYVSATPQAPPTPAAPTNLSATAGKKKVTLNWTQSSSSNISQNKIYRSNSNGGPYSLVTTINATTAYTDSGLTSGATYYYVVTAVNTGSVESSYSNQASATAK